MSSTMGRAGNYVFSPLGGVGPSTAKRNFSNDSGGDDELEAYGLSPEKKSGQKNLAASAGQLAVNNSSSSVSANKSTGKFMTSHSNPQDLLSISFDDVDNPSQPSAGIRHVHEEVECDIITPRGVIKASPRASLDGLLYEEGSTSVKLTYNKKDKMSTPPQKQSFGNQSTVVYNQRTTAKSPGPTIDREKEELLAALEVLKMQNQLLTSKIEKTQIESLNQIEQERNAKRALQAQLELENNRLKDQLMQAKLSAEEQLAREKDEFLAKIAQMEAEKASLQTKMQHIEEQSIMDANILRMQRSEMLDSIQKLEEERIQLHQKLSDNADVAAQLSQENSHQTAAQLELQRQRDELSQMLEKLEKDKAVLAASLEDTESKAKENERQLQQKLEEEQRQLNSSLAVMESEKQALLQKLISSEKEAEAHSEAMNKMLSEEQKKTQAALEELEQREKQLAAAQQAAASAASTPKASATASSAAITAAVQNAAASSTPVTSSNESGKLSNSSNSDKKAAMEAELAKIKEEREELQSKLAANLNNKHQTDLVSQLHNKLQLKKSVLRMKEELDQERLRQAKQQQQQQNKTEVALPDLKFDRFQKGGVPTSAPAPTEAPVTSKEAVSATTGPGPHSTPVKAPPSVSSGGASLSQIFAITPTSSNRSLATTNSGGATAHNASSRVLISPKKSLYDVLENSNAATLSSGMYDILSTGASATDGVAMHPKTANSYSKIHLTRRSMQFHQVEKIDEVDEKIFADWDSDEEEDGKKGKRSKSAKVASKTPVNETVSAAADVSAAPKTEEELEAELIASLPTPHAAAATGNMKKLEALCNLDTSLLKSLDSGGRKPLFYAAAYGKTEAVKFLIHLFPELVGDCDIHFDTALHAATSSGNAEIAELLIIAAGGTKEAAEPRNSLEMTPAHLASTSDCLDVLYRYEADICAMDAHLRSPLFVACAMNRVDCTEYLVNCLDSTTTGLGILLAKDKRGDTPLHAAACNGSEDCLLLLLQYGIDPRMVNDIGLKAIDLAIRNNHMKCKNILAEYYLHYCTSSEFDSVLFLATLEGHRMISEMNSGTHSDVAGSYQIIKKNSKQSLQGLMSPEGSPMKSLQGGGKMDPFAQSMFSLRAVKSLRLERWGAWIAYHDQQSQTVFWYNHESNEGQWNKPEQVTLMQISSREKKDYFDKTLQAKSSMRLTKVGDWIKYVTESGKIFFYNVVTNDFQWDDPTGTGHARDGSGKVVAANAAGTATTSDKSNSGKNAGNTGGDNDNAESGATGNPWRPYLDEETDTVFWYNSVTQVSQWECPFDNPTAAVGASLSPSFEDEERHGQKRRSSLGSVDEFEGDNAVFKVNHENDLDL